MTKDPSRFAVVGGGITGLSAAYALSQLAPDASIAVFEAQDRLGGKLHTETFHGAQVEMGADSFLTRDSAARDLCRAIGLQDELTAPAIFKGAVWDGLRRYDLPRGSVMGVPTSIRSLIGADALTAGEKLSASADALRWKRLRGHDVSVGSIVRSHFGDAVLERFVDPLLAGTRAGNVDEMSLAAALPQVDAAARASGSIMRGLRRASPSAGNDPLFLAPRRGMSHMIDALAACLPAGSIRLGTDIDLITADGFGDFVIRTRDGQELTADGVVIATPSPVAARLLREVSAVAAGELSSIPHASVAVVSLALRAGTLPADGSSGFLVPSNAGLTLSAGTWWSLKWPHTTPEGVFVARCFAGRAERHPALDLDDEALVAAVAGELTQLLGTSVKPIEGKVTRWDDGLPQYQVGHLDRLGRIERALHQHSGIALAGADYRGSGIPDCIRQGRAAAERVHKAVAARGGRVET
ncbi:MAG: protoporphyrinogen/coproporphyrinogen oxidase [Actinomycetota bacterium]|nr:protoporphyrinogen/coproporphyrinogen oxidase [Actinomycetota bacterium]